MRKRPDSLWPCLSQHAKLCQYAAADAWVALEVFESMNKIMDVYSQKDDDPSHASALVTQGKKRSMSEDMPLFKSIRSTEERQVKMTKEVLKRPQTIDKRQEKKGKKSKITHAGNQDDAAEEIEKLSLLKPVPTHKDHLRSIGLTEEEIAERWKYVVERRKKGKEMRKLPVAERLEKQKESKQRTKDERREWNAKIKLANNTHEAKKVTNKD
jgi:hypothetical protein